MICCTSLFFFLLVCSEFKPNLAERDRLPPSSDRGTIGVFHNGQNAVVHNVVLQSLQYAGMKLAEGSEQLVQEVKAAVGAGATDTSWHGQSSFVLDDAAKRNITPGFVVDIGAHDGIWQSNSYYFLQKGYPALLVEAMPETYAKLVANVRKYKMAKTRNVPVSLKDGAPVDLIRTGWYNGTMNKIGSCDDKAGPCVKSSSLLNLLAEEEVPHRSFLLSLDVEWHEDAYLKMLESLKPSKYTFDYIVVENCHNPGKMEELGYTFLTQLGYDSVYRRTGL